MSTALAVEEVFTRTLVLIGEDRDPQRRGGKAVLYRSECRFHCRTEAVLDRCVEEIRRSDEHLRSRPEEMVKWDWTSTYVERALDADEATVVLGVAWYNDEFFQNKMLAHRDILHLDKYREIGLNEGDITVAHWKLVGEYQV